MEKKELPLPFGLNNIGSICYFNALTQSLLSCSSIIKAIPEAKDESSDLNKTSTGKMFLNAVRTALIPNQSDMSKGSIAIDESWLPLVANISSKLLSALVADLEQKLNKNTFGRMQESASEGLVLLLDSMENPDSKQHSITKLFRHQYNVKLFCNKCREIVSEREDFGIDINLFFQDRIDKMTKPEEFADAIYQHISPLDHDYKCPACKIRVDGIRLHTLKICTTGVSV